MCSKHGRQIMSENLLAEKSDWDTLNEQKETKKNGSTNGTGRRDLQFMTFPKPGNYRIRLVGDMVEFRKHFYPINAVTLPSWRGEDPAWKAGFWPKKRYAIHCIDREDGQLKILEKGSGLFEEFSNYKNVKSINPAGKDGPDFIITVKIPKDDNGKYIKRSTEYKVMPDEKTPLTPEEIAMIKEVGFYDLSTIFKATALEKIQDMWDDLPEHLKTPKDTKKNSDSKPEKEVPVKAPPSSEMAESPADSGDDIFATKDKGAAKEEEPLW